MNPQPPPSVSIFYAILFVLMLIYYTIKAIKSNTTLSLSDNFILGYVEDTPVNVTVNVPEQKPVTITRTKKVIVEKPNFESQQLYVDCIDALYALGMKKKQAKDRAKFIFSSINPQPTTIQEFLYLALKIQP